MSKLTVPASAGCVLITGVIFLSILVCTFFGWLLQMIWNDVIVPQTGAPTVPLWACVAVLLVIRFAFSRTSASTASS